MALISSNKVIQGAADREIAPETPNAPGESIRNTVDLCLQTMHTMKDEEFSQKFDEIVTAKSIAEKNRLIQKLSAAERNAYDNATGIHDMGMSSGIKGYQNGKIDGYTARIERGSLGLTVD